MKAMTDRQQDALYSRYKHVRDFITRGANNRKLRRAFVALSKSVAKHCTHKRFK